MLLCTIQCSGVNQIQPIYISRLACPIPITKHPTLTKTSKKLKTKIVWGSETTEQRHRLSLHVAAVGRKGCLGFSSVAVTDLLSDLGNVFVP